MVVGFQDFVGPKIDDGVGIKQLKGYPKKSTILFPSNYLKLLTFNNLVAQPN